MAQSKLKRFIDKLEEVYQGDPWYGNAIKKDIDKVDPRLVFHKPLAQAHCIAELLAHMISWRELLLFKLQEDAAFAVKQETSFDWSRFDPNPETAWHTLTKTLDDNQRKIIALLQSADDGLLDQKVPDRIYTFRYLIEGIIEHDVYHQAQIVLLAKGGS